MVVDTVKQVCLKKIHSINQWQNQLKCVQWRLVVGWDVSKPRDIRGGIYGPAPVTPAKAGRERDVETNTQGSGLASWVEVKAFSEMGFKR